ncbi:hypothetical protein FGG08_006086 [Glutinoglossum americanum]|uniref:Uncharacterized protein n=1 Tax=Glutinoglossum americanum TaxID=1670608 RepID=A0A9P8L0R9_9PEZI|nr:hypothetical protein FGG08_006086 [Glutinoglossum americanum]
MDSSLKEKGRELSSLAVGTDGNTPHTDSSGGVIQTDSTSMTSKLVASASSLSRGLLGIDASPEILTGALAYSETAGKSQTISSGDTSASSTWGKGSGSSRAAGDSSTQYRPSFRTETQQEQASEIEFAGFLVNQPVQTVESPSITTESYQPSNNGGTPTHGQRSTYESALRVQRAQNMLIANDVNPNLLTASQFQSFQQQDTSEQQQSIRSYIRSGITTWDAEVGCPQQNLQAASEEINRQSELESTQRARNILIINDINPDLLTPSQFLSFQQEDLSKQKHLIRTYFEGLNIGIKGNGWARRVVNEKYPNHSRLEQPEDTLEQGSRPQESSLQLYNQQDGTLPKQECVRMDTDEPKTASVDLPPKRNVAMGQINHPMHIPSGAQRAIELLVANGINPEQLTASQFNSFQQQNLNVQQKSVEVYLQNLAQHKRSLRQQEQRQKHHPQQEEDGAAVVSLLSQPNFLDLIDTSQDDDDLPPIWSVDLTPSQSDTIERLRALLPAPPTSSPSIPTHASNLLPADVLNIPSLWDSKDATVGSTYFKEQVNRRQQWLRDWDGVLRRYADEVWGDLLPLVEEAREEIEEAKGNDGELQGEGRAVRRLAMILGHLGDDKIAQNG